MKTYLGIWMDNRSAYIKEYKYETIETNSINYPFSNKEKSECHFESEHVLHNKVQQKLSEYYKNLGAIIKNYDEVLLFGPTDAKVELYNMLRADACFEKINIGIKQAGLMTENQQHSYVKNHFSIK